MSIKLPTIQTLPFLFKAIAVFHLLLFCYSLYNAIGFSLKTFVWLFPLNYAIYSAIWFWVSYLKKKAAIAYIVYTCLNLILWIKPSQVASFNDYRSITLFPIDCILVFLLLFIYKQLK